MDHMFVLYLWMHWKNTYSCTDRVHVKTTVLSKDHRQLSTRIENILKCVFQFKCVLSIVLFVAKCVFSRCHWYHCWGHPGLCYGAALHGGTPPERTSWCLTFCPPTSSPCLDPDSHQEEPVWSAAATACTHTHTHTFRHSYFLSSFSLFSSTRFQLSKAFSCLFPLAYFSLFASTGCSKMLTAPQRFLKMSLEGLRTVKSIRKPFI